MHESRRDVGSSIGALDLMPGAGGGPLILPDDGVRQGAEATAPHVVTTLTDDGTHRYIDLGDEVWDDFAPHYPRRVLPPFYDLPPRTGSPVMPPKGRFPEDGPDEEESPDGFQAVEGAGAASPILLEHIHQEAGEGAAISITAAGLPGDQPRIAIVGCGGGGSNMVGVVDAMGLAGARTISINTDQIHLEEVDAQKRVLMGRRQTGGLGTGGDAAVGKASIESCEGVLVPMFSGKDLVLVLTSLGGGTGTGATPHLCELAREAGATVVVLATLPFKMEAARRAKGFESLPTLRASADNVLLFDMDHLMEAVPEMPVHEALGFMNELVGEVVRGLVETTTRPSRINIDFADLRAVLTEKGLSQVLIGEVDSTDPMMVVNATVDNPFADLDHTGAAGALIHITGGDELTLSSAQRIADLLTLSLDEGANVILGARIDPDMGSRVKVIALFTGIEPDEALDIDIDVSAGVTPAEGEPDLVPDPRTSDIFAHYGVTGLQEAGARREEVRLMGTQSEVDGVSYYTVSDVPLKRRAPRPEPGPAPEPAPLDTWSDAPKVRAKDGGRGWSARKGGAGQKKDTDGGVIPPELDFEFILEDWETKDPGGPRGGDPLQDIMIQ
jgi:cell division protein FtsZ